MCSSDFSIELPLESSPTADKKRTSCPNRPNASAMFLPTPPLTCFIWPANIRPSSWKKKRSQFLLFILKRQMYRWSKNVWAPYPSLEIVLTFENFSFSTSMSAERSFSNSNWIGHRRTDVLRHCYVGVDRQLFSISRHLSNGTFCRSTPASKQQCFNTGFVLIFIYWSINTKLLTPD